MKILTTLFPKPTHIGYVLRTAAHKADVDGEVSDYMILAATYIRTLEEQVRQFEMVTLARQLLEDFCEPNELPAPLIKDGIIKWDDFPTEGSKIVITPCRDGYLVEGFGLGTPKRVECLPYKLNDVLIGVINTLRNQKPSLVQCLQHLGECEVITQGTIHPPTALTVWRSPTAAPSPLFIGLQTESKTCNASIWGMFRIMPPRSKSTRWSRTRRFWWRWFVLF